jgi:hypothetical protein
MTIRRPTRPTEWLRLIAPALILIASVALGFYAERFAPRQGMTAFTVVLAGMVPSLVMSIAMGCWMLRVHEKGDYSLAVKGGMIGLGIFAANFLAALPGIVVVGRYLRPIAQ